MPLTKEIPDQLLGYLLMESQKACERNIEREREKNKNHSSYQAQDSWVRRTTRQEQLDENS